MIDESIQTIKKILLKVADGDESAFAQLFKIYYDQLGDFINRITESEELTEDIVQDVFLKIWLHRSYLTEIECFWAYLLVVARNHAFNCLKKIARERLLKKEWTRFVLLQTSVEIDETATKDKEGLIDEAIQLLPPQQKKVYIMSRRKRMKQAEIARELNISLETVKKHMVLALRFIKNQLRSHISSIFFLISYFFKN